MEATQESNNGINGMERMLTVNDIATIMGYSTHTVREMETGSFNPFF